MEMPSQEEQNLVEKYVLERPLNRPDTDARKAVKCGILYVVCTLVLGFVLVCLFDWLGIFAWISPSLADFQTQHPMWFTVLFFAAVFVLTGIVCLRMAVIGCIKLYQHYADEDIRRRCLFQPTCSEYAILAVRKYGVIIGLVKAYIRLFWKCRGNIYRMDYP